MFSNGARRSKIRAPKKNLASEVDFEKSWSVLADAIRQIEHKNASDLSFEELYRKSYNLVLRKYGKLLYEAVKELIGTYLSSKREYLINDVSLKNDRVLFLREVKSIWEDHTLSMRMIGDVLMYLDRVYAKENHLPLIYDVGINLFRDNIIKHNNNEIGNILNSYIMDELTANRNGFIIDIFLSKSIINMFESLVEDEKTLELGENYYLKYFEPFFLSETFKYYEKLGNEIFGQNNGTAYLKKVMELITNEQNKCILCLPNVTYPKLVSLVDKTLITRKIDAVMKFSNEGLKHWLTYDRYPDLILLYELLSRVDYFDGFKEQLKDIIIEQGLALDEDDQLNDPAQEVPSTVKHKQSSNKKITADAISWIKKVIMLKGKYDLILKSLNNDVNIQKAIDNAYVEFLNKNVKISEYLSLFIDDIIKKPGNKSEEEIEEALDKSIVIFRFIKDKDVFEKYYKNHLAKRLLRSSSDLERVMISKIKNEIGSSFTSKFEGMFRDINFSKEVSKNFNRKQFEINVLTKTFWPINPPSNSNEIILSPQLEPLKKSFDEYYLNLHSGRNLTWAYNFGSIDIRIKFDKKIHELNMSLYCGLIVLLFEEEEELSFEQIEQLTRIPKPDLIRSLQSIAVAPRTRILIKKPMSKDIKNGDIFKFNHLFTAPMTKVKVLTVANKAETDTERSKTIEKVDEDRKYELDAAIVRIMKSRKTLRHNELVVETVKQIARFKPSPQSIKKRIEALLEREYLQRDSEDRNVYHYLA